MLSLPTMGNLSESFNLFVTNDLSLPLSKIIHALPVISGSPGFFMVATAVCKRTIGFSDVFLELTYPKVQFKVALSVSLVVFSTGVTDF